MLGAGTPCLERWWRSGAAGCGICFMLGLTEEYRRGCCRRNVDQPSRLSFRAKRFANLPSSPGEKTGVDFF
jgi:hypothetical protein